MDSRQEALIQAASELAEEADDLSFQSPKIHSIYNPLVYAWASHRSFIEAYGAGRKRILFVGMNPGPWGMAQTGIPFGEVTIVREWLGIEEEIGQPPREHPKRKIEGFDCRRSEVSGKRFWGLMRERFVTAQSFFRDHYAVNYCPLVFMEESGKNLTPDKLQRDDREELFELCRLHMSRVIEALSPEHLVGIGKFAEKQLEGFTEENENLRVSSIPHPSPANPQANKGWSPLALRKLVDEGIWARD